jgi:hypothetical protein
MVSEAAVWWQQYYTHERYEVTYDIQQLQRAFKTQSGDFTLFFLDYILEGTNNKIEQFEHWLSIETSELDHADSNQFDDLYFVSHPFV